MSHGKKHLIIFVFILLQCYSICVKPCTSIYKINKLRLIDGICKIKENKNDTDNPITYNVQICDIGYYCPQTGNDIESCLFDYSLKIEGEECHFNFECYSGKCDSTSYQCLSLHDGDSCSTHYACGINSFCSIQDGTNKCTPLIDVEGACTLEDSCKLGLGCNKETKKCVKMFSLKNGDPASHNYLCSSGVLENNKCIDTSPKTSNEKCSSDDDCIIIKKIEGQTDKEDKGECVCDLEGNNYCNLTSSSDEWKEYVSTFNQEISNIDIYKVHQAGKRNFKKYLLFDWGNNKIRTAYHNFDVKYKHVNKDIIYAVGKSTIQKFSLGILVLLFYSIV